MKTMYINIYKTGVHYTVGGLFESKTDATFAASKSHNYVCTSSVEIQETK